MMAPDLHQAQLLLPSPSSLFPSQSNQPLIPSEQIFEASPPPPPPSSSDDRGQEEGEVVEDAEMDDFTAELTRRMAHFMLQEDDDEFPLPSCGLAEHHQSASDFGGFMCLKKSWSYADSPRSPHRSPPINPSMSMETDADRAQGVPYDIINRFEKMDLAAKKGVKHYHDSYSQGNKAPSTSASPSFPQHPNLVHHSNLAISGDMEPRRMQVNLPAKNERRTGKRCYLQHRRTRWAPGSGMQAVFLGGAGSRSGSCGTGVFLPRGAGNSNESRKQPRCSTVLIPARVVQALTTHFERMGSQSGVVADGRVGLYFQQKKQSRPASASALAPELNNNDMCWASPKIGSIDTLWSIL